MNMDSVNNDREVRMQIDQYNQKLQKVFPGVGDPNYVSPPIWKMNTEQLETLWELVGPEEGLTEEQLAQVKAALEKIDDSSRAGIFADTLEPFVRIFENAEEETDAQS